MRQTLPLALALLLLGAAAHAQESSRPQAQSFRVEWTRLPPTMRPGVEGYVYNDSTYRIGLVRLTILSRDEPSQAPTPTLAWVYGNVPARGRWYFRVRLPASREVVKVSIESFTLISRDPPAESP